MVKTLRSGILSVTCVNPWKWGILIGILFACLVCYVFQIEPAWVETVPITVEIPQLETEFDGIRIIQLSDLHMDGAWMTSKRLQHIVNLVEQQNPDLVVITGDLIDHDPHRYASDLIAPLSQLTKATPTFAVLGNHDYKDDAAPVKQALSQSQVLELPNSVYTLTRDSASLHIAGVDDVWMRRDRLEQVLEQLPETGTAILLVHEPDFADTAASSQHFALSLSGHSHGGQVRFPFSGPILLPPYGKRYPQGRYQIGSMVQYTNRGVGMVRPRGRFNCRPEITVITLSAATK